MIRVAFIACLAMVSASACQTMNPQKDRPARLERSDSATDRLLSEVVSKAVGQSISVQSQSLTISSVVSLENRSRGSLSSMPPNGRIMERPIQFRLVENSGKCYLIDSRDDARYLLNSVVCIPEDSAG